VKYINIVRAWIHAHHTYVVALGLALVALGEMLTGNLAGAQTDALRALAVLGICLAGKPA
jgi:hypothetical protein